MKLAHRGLGVDLPPGWDARIYRRAERVEEATTHAVLHAANFGLPPDRGDFGSGAVELMGPSHVLVVLLEHHPDAASTPLFANRGMPRRLTPAMFSPHQLQRTIGGQAGTQVFFHEAGRAFCLYVVLGSYLRGPALVPLVNTVLASLAIEPGAG
ncbi:MAG TPA: hypothetical protein VNA14_01575 [Mycobacteriales bacterium]|nr:hypothetical protein [Mycobacteriales bacterium]